MITRISIILSLLLGSFACAIVPPIGNVPPPEILEQYLPSPLIPVDTSPGGSIGLLKYLPDGTQVQIAGKVVSGLIDGEAQTTFYVQEADRSAGIRVTAPQYPSLQVGEAVNISGVLATTNGERVLQAGSIISCSLPQPVVPEPVLLSLADIGGGPAGYQPGVTLRVPSTGVSILDAIGINNIGLLAQIYGKVTYVSGDQTYFYVDDGSDVYFNSAITGGMDDNIGSDVWDGTTHEISGTIYKNLGVMVSIANLTTEMRNQIDENDFIGVAGIVGTRLDSENRVLPLLQPRSDADIASDPSTISLLSPGDRIVPELQYNLTCLPLPIAFDSAHSAQYPPRAYYFMGQGYLWTYSALHHAQKQLPVDPQDYLKPISNLTHGAGYWLRLSGPGVSYQAVDDDTTDRWISLPYAWYNLFGHPFNHDVLWGDIKVTDGKRMAGLEEAAWSLNWVCSVGVWWEPGPSSSRDIGLPEDYAFTETMQSWHAYHMYAYKQPVALIVPGTTYPPGPGIPARGSILATVTDTSTPANPLIGARVYCKYGSALTEMPNGTALIEGLPPAVSPDPPYLVTASAQGYKSQSQLVYVTEGDPITVDFALESQSGITLSLTANPSRVRPDGISTSMITVYAADREGVPLSGKSVIVTTDFSTFQESGTNTVPGSTGDEGTLSAHLGPSLLQGIATVTATCEGQTASIQVQFRTIVYVKPGGTGGGSSWGDAMGSVQGGLDATGVQEVWVAGDSDHPYEENITLVDGVGLYGGFDATESYREDRDWRENTTILHGQGTSENPASVVDVPVGGPTTIIDGFTITNGYGYYAGGVYCTNSSPTISNNIITSNQGTGESVSGGGLYCYNSSATIQGNIIRGNTSSTVGGGICCYSCPEVSIINNQIDQNSSQFSGSAIYSDSPGMIANNTILHNTAAGEGHAVCVYGSSTTVANNIIAFNSSGICGSGDTILENNDVYLNPESNPADYCGDLAHDTDISEDPDFVNRLIGDYHLQPGSPCINAGDDSVIQTGSVDIDGQARTNGVHVDIGADEYYHPVDCTWYRPTLTVNPIGVEMGDTDTVTVTVSDPVTEVPISSRRADFSVTGGELVSIYNDDEGIWPPDVPPTTGYGITGTNGRVYAEVTRDTPGWVTVTARVSNSCETGETSKSAALWFYDPSLGASDVVFVLDRSGSMTDHEASCPTEASVQALVREISSLRPDVRFGAVMFDEGDPTTRSISEFVGQNAVDDFCDWVDDYCAAGGTEAQIDALNEAADDLDEYSPSSSRRFVVFVTDSTMDNSSQAQHLQVVQALDALTDSNGGGVFISLWEVWQGWLHAHFSQGFTDDPAYPSLAVNGGFDSTHYPDSSPAKGRYLFDELKDRILYGE